MRLCCQDSRPTFLCTHARKLPRVGFPSNVQTNNTELQHRTTNTSVQFYNICKAPESLLLIALSSEIGRRRCLTRTRVALALHRLAFPKMKSCLRVYRASWTKRTRMKAFTMSCMMERKLPAKGYAGSHGVSEHDRVLRPLQSPPKYRVKP